MALEEITQQLSTSTTRRTVVKTGMRLAYAAPVVAASYKLSAMSARAQAVSGGCETTFCCSCIKFDPETQTSVVVFCRSDITFDESCVEACSAAGGSGGNFGGAPGVSQICDPTGHCQITCDSRPKL